MGSLYNTTFWLCQNSHWTWPLKSWVFPLVYQRVCFGSVLWWVGRWVSNTSLNTDTKYFLGFMRGSQFSSKHLKNSMEIISPVNVYCQHPWLMILVPQNYQQPSFITINTYGDLVVSRSFLKAKWISGCCHLQCSIDSISCEYMWMMVGTDSSMGMYLR